jgi:hypothetical protein
MMGLKTWNHLLRFIKQKLSQKIVELSDKEIIDIVRYITIPEFSNYVPALEEYIITEKDLCNPHRGSFRIPFEDKSDVDRILDIYDIYLSSGGEFISTRDRVVDSLLGSWVSYAGTASSPVPVPKLDDLQPGCITFLQHYSSVVQYLPATVILKMIHKDLKTIPTEAYVRWFLPIALGDVCMVITGIRTDFNGLNTPIGQINLDDPLIQRYIQDRDAAYNELKMRFNSFGILTIP